MGLLLALKLLLISTGVLFAALGVHVSVPLITDFMVTHVSLTWNFILSYKLNPPYLFLLLNTLIIGIAASTMFRNSLSPPPPSSHTLPPPPPPHLYITDEEEEYSSPTPVDLRAVVVNGVATEEDGITKSAWIQTLPSSSTGASPETTEVTLREMEASSTSPYSAEPPSPGMDDVWKAITKGRKMMKRSETFVEKKRDRVRKEPLLGRDELNRRVEEFIRTMKR